MKSFLHPPSRDSDLSCRLQQIRELVSKPKKKIPNPLFSELFGWSIEMEVGTTTQLTFLEIKQGSHFTSLSLFDLTVRA